MDDYDSKTALSMRTRQRCHSNASWANLGLMLIVPVVMQIKYGTDHGNISFDFDFQFTTYFE